MPDSIGRISVPEIAASGTFPLVTDYAHEQTLAPDVVVHRFGSSSAKIEQRFWRGNGARRYVFRKNRMTHADTDSLLAFWEAREGPHVPFTYNAPADAHGGSPSAVTVRFTDPAITLDYVSQLAAGVGLVLAEVPSSSPTHTLNSTEERFPGASLETALLDQVQEIIPLLKIRVTEVAVDDIFVSDRRVTVGSQLYLERLLEWDGITQAMNGQVDQATFSFGNADRVMTALANDTDLNHALVVVALRVLPRAGGAGGNLA